MVRPILTALFLAVATTAFAQPLITGVSPTEGPTNGGTTVTITGVGFAVETAGGVSYWPEVYFGDLRARSETLVNNTTLIATTPAHVSGPVAVQVRKISGTSTANDAFRYVGSDADAIRRFLVPILVRPIPGAYGSEFRSELWVWNPSRWVATLKGLPEDSNVICLCLPLPFSVQPGTSARAVPAGNPGRFVEVANDPADTLAMNLRVYDTSRSSTNFGTEIPVVPSSSFRQTVALTGIPTDPRFRLMLRVYGSAPSPAGVISMSFAGETTQLRLRNGADRFDPSYAELNLSIPADVTAASLNLRLDSLSAADDVPASPIWAFITVTNNETQHITTITPQASR